jgi:ATP-dependent DNA helicase RecG
LRGYGLPPAHFVDSGIQFTAVLHRQAAPPPGLTATEARVYGPLGGDRSRTAIELADELALSPANVRKNLRALAGRGLLTQFGGRGRPTVYRRSGA